MKYADSSRCPSCANNIVVGSETCPSCGLRFNTVEAANLWQALSRADYWLTQAQRVSVKIGKPAPSYATPVNATADLPKYPTMTAPVKARKPIDVGALLLMLGALFLMVAGSIASALFLGVFALPLMAVVAAGIGIVTDNRGLKASTETMIVLTIAMGSLFTGIFMWDSSFATMIWALLGIIASFTFAVLIKDVRTYRAPTISTSFFALIFWLACSGTLDEKLNSLNSLIFIIPTIIVLGLLSISLLTLQTKTAIYSLSSLASLFTVISLLATLNDFGNVTIADNGLNSLYVEGKAYGAITLITLFAVIGIFFTNVKPKWPSAISFIASYYLTLALGVLTFAESSFSEFTAIFLGLTVASLAYFTKNEVKEFFTWALIAPAVGVFFTWFAIVSTDLLLAAEKLLTIRYRAWNEPLWAEPLEGWLPLTLMAVIGLNVLVFFKKTNVKEYNSVLHLAAATWAGISFILFVLYGYPTNFTLPFAMIVVGIAVAVYTRTAMIGSIFIIAAPPLTLLYAGTASIIVSLAAISLTVLVFTLKDSKLVQHVCLMFASLYAIVGLAAFGFYDKWLASTSLTTVVVAIAGLLLASAVLRKNAPRYKYAIDAGIAIPLVGALMLAPGEVSFPYVSFLLCVIGVVFTSISFFEHNKTYRLAGAASLGLAWIIRLGASEISTPEAYTAPFAIALLLSGGYKMYKDASVSSMQVLTPGLLLTFLPSVPWILADPASFRALIFTIVATAALLLGIHFKLKAPVIIAGALLAWVSLVELGPYILMIHRWLLIGIFGALFTALGITFEDRVKEGKRIASYVKNLR